MTGSRSQRFRWTRRAFLSSLLAPLGYLSYRVAAHNQWIIVTRRARSYAIGREPGVSRNGGQLSLLVAGDTGADTPARSGVIAAMKRHAARSSPDAALLLGDNFYERGVESVDDPRFHSDFEQLFDDRSFGFPFYVCLGNHDWYGDGNAQVRYTGRSERWTMPGRYFKIRQLAGRATVDLFAIDTDSLITGRQDPDQQLPWLRRELAASDADWKLVFGHHPALTGGQHEAAPRIAEQLPPLFEEYGVNLYLSGHDHDLQLNDSGRGWLQVVCGSGSKLRSTCWTDDTLFAQAVPGFCWLLLDKRQIAISFYSADERLFTHVVPSDRSPLSRSACRELLKA